MNEDNKKRIIIDQSAKAFTEYLKRISVGLCVRPFSDEPEVGSGTCIRFGTNYYIATAAHVVRNQNADDIKILFKAGRHDPTVKISNISIDYRKDDGIDVALLKIPESEAIRIGKSFISEEVFKTNIDDLDRDFVVIHGFPSVWAKWIKDFDFSFKTLAYLTITHGSQDWKSDASPESEIEVEYPKEVLDAGSGSFVDLPNAPGISGGALWFLNFNDKQTIWTPEKARLIGINRCWEENARWVKATNISYLKKLSERKGTSNK